MCLTSVISKGSSNGATRDNRKGNSLFNTFYLTEENKKTFEWNNIFDSFGINVVKFDLGESPVLVGKRQLG